jgi:chemosensory pili system protein ChpC
MAEVESVVRSQLLPLNGMSLVLPNTCIAEVIGYRQPEAVDNAPEWLLGMIDWRGLRIPLISFERANEQPLDGNAKSKRITVLNGINGNDDLAFYGVLTQGIPRLISVNKSRINAITKPDTKLPLALEQTMIDELHAVIPDQDKIENLLKQQNIKSGAAV